MTNLRDEWQAGKIETFVAEHEADPQGDLDKLDAALKHPVQGSEPEVPSSSSRGASDDWSGTQTL